MKRAIAKIRLAPGNAGWYDPLTNIYLTLSKKECFVYNDQDITNIRKAIKQNKLVLKEGRLPSPASKQRKEIIEDEPVKQVKPKKQDKVIEKVEVIEEKEEVGNERHKKKVKRKPDDSKLQRQEEVKEEIIENKEVDNPLVKVAELTKNEDKDKEDCNG